MSDIFTIDSDFDRGYIVNVFYEDDVLVIEFSGDIPLVLEFLISQTRGGNFVVKSISS